MVQPGSQPRSNAPPPQRLITNMRRTCQARRGWQPVAGHQGILAPLAGPVLQQLLQNAAHAATATTAGGGLTLHARHPRQQLEQSAVMCCRPQPDPQVTSKSQKSSKHTDGVLICDPCKRRESHTRRSEQFGVCRIWGFCCSAPDWHQGVRAWTHWPASEAAAESARLRSATRFQETARSWCSATTG